jgi:hypothetical protein
LNSDNRNPLIQSFTVFLINSIEIIYCCGGIYFLMLRLGGIDCRRTENNGPNHQRTKKQITTLNLKG